jgi:hypothetical protein
MERQSKLGGLRAEKAFKHDFADNRIKAQKSEVDGIQIDYQEL